MTWNYRQNGEWKTATIKRREGEKWVPPLGQGATHGDRNGTTHRASDYGSSESDLQSAFDALSTGDTLDIDQDYTGSHWDFPMTNHITITSSTNASLYLDSSGEELFDWSDWSLTTTPASAVAKGETIVAVDDASVFSVGDDIRLFDDNETYRGVTSWDSSSTLAEDRNQGQFAVVEEVNTSNNTITMDRPAHWDYNDPAGTLQLDRIDWAVEDVIIEYLSFYGHYDSDNGFLVRASSNITVRNCHFETWGKFNSSGKDGSMASFARCFRVTVRDSTCREGDRYGWRMYAGTTDTWVHNCESWDLGRYLTLQSHAGSMNPAYDHLVTDCVAHNSESRAYDQHFAGEKMVVRDCVADNCKAFYIRGHDFYAENITVTGSSIQGDLIDVRYWARNIEINGLTVDVDENSTTRRVIQFDLDKPPADNWVVRNVDTGSTDMYTLALRTPPSGDLQVDNFEAVNWRIGGDLIETASEFERLYGDSSGKVGELIVRSTE